MLGGTADSVQRRGVADILVSPRRQIPKLWGDTTESVGGRFYSATETGTREFRPCRGDSHEGLVAQSTLYSELLCTESRQDALTLMASRRDFYTHAKVYFAMTGFVIHFVSRV